jgi:uncharacterized membrane protein YgdD (TMEM256/DUF423 family)
MRMIAILAAALATLSVTVPASAQMSASTRSEMAKMRAANPASYNACHSLAIQRGYSTNDQEHEGRALMNFISGCMAMRGR